MSVDTRPDRPLPADDGPRACRFGWCTCTHKFDGDEHVADRYVSASKSAPMRPTLTVGAGVVVTDDAHPNPEVFVHITDRDGQVDEDAYLTVDEAVDLVDALVVAIGHARTTTAVSGE